MDGARHCRADHGSLLLERDVSIQCEITGCALIHGDEWVAGDLFDAGTHWVFNGNVELQGSRSIPLWMPISEAHYTKTISPLDWWEKRGVFVIEKSKANMNQKAIDYIEGLS
jgi:hypothetical protein